MIDDETRELLRLLALYFEHYGPNGKTEPGGPPPSNLLVSELAGDLRDSLPRGEVVYQDRLDRLGLR